MSDTVKPLGVIIESKLRFNEHVKIICQKTNNKVKASSRIVRHLESQEASLLYNSFILTNFNYCPFIWIFCGKTPNDKVNSVHTRALRVLLNDYTSSFEELLHGKLKVTSSGGPSTDPHGTSFDRDFRVLKLVPTLTLCFLSVR